MCILKKTPPKKGKKEIIKMANKTNNITKTLIAVGIAFVIAVSSALIMGAVRVDAATQKTARVTQKADSTQLPKSTTNKNQFAKAYTIKASGKTSRGYDWTYKTDYKNIKVKCKYDFKAHKYTFTITGKSYGLNHLTLKYKTSDKKWASKKLTLFVDSQNYIMRTA